MKIQLGLLNLTNRPITREDHAALLGELSSRPFETTGDLTTGPLLMVYRGDRITHEEDSEIQPLRRGPYVLTWDGRLDNREDLANRAGIPNADRVPDPVIVLEAFERFGEGIFADLIGEFALTLWSELDRTILFARSCCGSRPLYYVLDQSRLIWSSAFAHLVRVSNVDRTVRDEYVLQYLVTTPDAKTTPLANVHPIPPNRVMRFKNGSMDRGQELWNPIRLAPLQYRNDSEYEEHCRQEVYAAVKARLRSKYPIYAELSGGLDSSTIVLTADRVLRDRNESPDRLQTVSCVYERSKSADERRFIEAVAEQRGIHTHLIHEADQRIGLDLDGGHFEGFPSTLQFFPGRYEVISSLMQDDTARVLFTGRGGDHLFWSAQDGAPIIADEIYRLNLIGAHERCQEWSRVAATRYYDLAIRSLRLSLGSAIPNKFFYERPELPDWVHPRYRSTVQGLTADFEGYTKWHASPSQRTQVFSVDRMFRMLGSGFGEEYPNIYVSHPYSHRPLVEFCLRTPLSQMLRNGQNRSLMRRAFRDVLPGKVASRMSKGLVDEALARSLNQVKTLEDLRSWQVCTRGYIAYPKTVKALRRGRLGSLEHVGSLIRLFAIERWLRSLDRICESSLSYADWFRYDAQSAVRFQVFPKSATGLRNC